MYELQGQAGEKRGARQLLEDGAVTDKLINAVPDFGGLFYEPGFKEALERAGYGEALSELEA